MASFSVHKSFEKLGIMQKALHQEKSENRKGFIKVLLQVQLVECEAISDFSHIQCTQNYLAQCVFGKEAERPKFVF